MSTWLGCTCAAQDVLDQAERNRAQLRSLSCTITYVWEKLPSYGEESGEMAKPKTSVYRFRVKGEQVQLQQIAQGPDQVTSDYLGSLDGQISWTTQPRKSWYDVPQAIASESSRLGQVVSPISVGFEVDGKGVWQLGSSKDWRVKSATELERTSPTESVLVVLDPGAGGLVESLRTEYAASNTVVRMDRTGARKVGGVWLPSGARITVESKPTKETLMAIAVTFQDFRVNEEPDLPTRPDLAPGTRVLEEATGRSYRVREDGSWELMVANPYAAWARLFAILVAALLLFALGRKLIRAKRTGHG